jgi:hypothetical protein
VGIGQEIWEVAGIKWVKGWGIGNIAAIKDQDG